MNEREKELAALELKGERRVLDEMRENYKVALGRVNARISKLSGRDDLSGIRQKRYQEALAEQIGAIIDDLGRSANRTLGEYLRSCYQDGFVGTLYNLQKQGIPLAFPLDQAKAARAVTMSADGVKLSKRIYSNADKLKRQVVAEITRGFADASSSTRVAANIAADTDIEASIKRNVKGRTDQAFRRSMTIARTEKGRVMADARLDAMRKAKEAGADIVKQWDSTMDSRTRKDHRELDGQIREIEEPFEVRGHKAMAPHKFGRPEEDINCRCTCLQRARAALEMPEGARASKWDGDKQCFVDLSDAKSYQDFKRRYDKLADGAVKRAASNNGRARVMAREMDLYGGPPAQVKSIADGLQRNVRNVWHEYKIRGDYASTMGALIESFSGKGMLTAQRGAEPKGKELQLASWLARAGHDIELLKPSGLPGDHTPDMRMDGELWEAKRVETANPTKLKARVAEAKRQARNVVVDLSANGRSDLDVLIDAAVSMLDDPMIDRIMVIAQGNATVYGK